MAAVVEGLLGIDLSVHGCAAAILVTHSVDVKVDSSGYVLLASPAETGGGGGHTHGIEPES